MKGDGVGDKEISYECVDPLVTIKLRWVSKSS